MAGRGSESTGNRVAIEHFRLDALFTETVEQLHAPARPGAARDAFVRLRDQLEAHLLREERLYFPALELLRPAHRQTLAMLIAAHGGFRLQLAEIEASLAGGALESAARGIEALSSLFAAHELAEESMLHQIEQELHTENIPSAC
jgi:iron-sulfur cluster repair protein YtfE (RIC family)